MNQKREVLAPLQICHYLRLALQPLFGRRVQLYFDTSWDTRWTQNDLRVWGMLPYAQHTTAITVMRRPTDVGPAAELRLFPALQVVHVYAGASGIVMDTIESDVLSQDGLPWFLFADSVVLTDLFHAIDEVDPDRGPTWISQACNKDTFKFRVYVAVDVEVHESEDNDIIQVGRRYRNEYPPDAYPPADRHGGFRPSHRVVSADPPPLQAWWGRWTSLAIVGRRAGPRPRESASAMESGPTTALERRQ